MEAGQQLPKHLLSIAVKRGNEFGWRQEHFVDVVNAAAESSLAVIGGQVQYLFPDGTCELYWLTYDPASQQIDEHWQSYCNRSANECIDKFNNLIRLVDIKSEAIQAFSFLKQKSDNGIEIDDYKVFIVYFEAASPF